MRNSQPCSTPTLFRRRKAHQSGLCGFFAPSLLPAVLLPPPPGLPAGRPPVAQHRVHAGLLGRPYRPLRVPLYLLLHPAQPGTATHVLHSPFDPFSVQCICILPTLHLKSYRRSWHIGTVYMNIVCTWKGFICTSSNFCSLHLSNPCSCACTTCGSAEPGWWGLSRRVTQHRRSGAAWHCRP